jgi:hypothetical protein
LLDVTLNVHWSMGEPGDVVVSGRELSILDHPVVAGARLDPSEFGESAEDAGNWPLLSGCISRAIPLREKIGSVA